MALQLKTFKEIFERVKSDFKAEFNSASTELHSFTIGILKAVAGAEDAMHKFVKNMADEIMPDTATGIYLERWGALLGLSRVTAKFATGDVNFTGTDTTPVPIDTELQDSDGNRFKTTEAVNISGTTAIGVTAINAGKAGNKDSGDTLTLVSPIAGVDSNATVGTNGLTGGVDKEEDEELRQRIYDYLQNPVGGGNKADYVKWVKEYGGMGVIEVLPYDDIDEQVRIFLLDEDLNTPDQATLDAVKDYICDDKRKPITADITVTALTKQAQTIDLAISPDTTEVRTAVENNLKSLFLREAKAGGTILLSHIKEAISTAVGENDYQLNSPTANIVMSNDGDYPVLTTPLTWSDWT